MKQIVIFGINDFAELANFYINSDTEYKVAAFSVTKEFIPASKKFCELPVIDFSEIEANFPPSEYDFFAPMAPTRMNKVREQIYSEVKSRGYEFISYISSKATVLTDAIGENCFILEDNTIQPFVEIGNNSVIWSGNHIGHHSRVADNVTITSQVVISGHCDIGRNCFLGVNSSISNGVKLAEGTLVSLATVIERDTTPWTVYKGNPAEKFSIRSDRVKF